MRGTFNFSAKIDEKEPKIFDLVKSDEKILKSFSPNTTAYVLRKIILMLPIAIVWLLVDIVFIIYVANISNAVVANAGLVVLIVFFFGLHLMPIWLWVWGTTQTCSDLRNTEYVLTTKRLIIKNGIKSANFTIINLKDVTAINTKQRLCEKMLKSGDISVNSRLNAVMLYNVYDLNETLKLLMETLNAVNKEYVTPEDFKTMKTLKTK